MVVSRTKKTSRANPAAVGQPPILKGVDELKERLLGTDREDHWNELLDMEQEIKRELLKNDLTKHKGMQMLLDWMMRYVRDSNALLTSAKTKDLSDSQRDGLIENRDFISALITFLDPKGKRLKQLEKELEYQLEGEEEETK
jgi:hypothetical protein